MNPYALDITSDMNSDYMGLFIDSVCVAFVYGDNLEALMEFKSKYYPNKDYAISTLHMDHPNSVVEIATLPDRTEDDF